jgi:hypothetical protein
LAESVSRFDACRALVCCGERGETHKKLCHRFYKTIESRQLTAIACANLKGHYYAHKNIFVFERLHIRNYINVVILMVPNSGSAYE